jgi:hypothetical protein
MPAAITCATSSLAAAKMLLPVVVDGMTMTTPRCLALFLSLQASSNICSTKERCLEPPYLQMFPLIEEKVMAMVAVAVVVAEARVVALFKATASRPHNSSAIPAL